jgi:transposase InsO family protein
LLSVEARGYPAIIKSNNGAEFASKRIEEWIETRPTDTYFIEAGSPWQNGHNESFNGVLRDGCLNRLGLTIGSVSAIRGRKLAPGIQRRAAT